MSVLQSFTYIWQVLLCFFDAESLLVFGWKLAEQSRLHLLELLSYLLLTEVFVHHLRDSLLVKAYNSEVVHQSIALLQLIVELLLLPLLLLFFRLLTFSLDVW